MNKKAILWSALDLVFLVVFNTVFFMAGGGGRVASVWIAYGFIHLAYAMVVATPFLIGKGSNAAIFGYSLYAISSAYFLLELVVGVVFILIKADSCKVSLIVQMAIAAVYAIVLLVTLLANEHTAEGTKRHEKEVAFIKTAASRVKALESRGQNRKVNKEIAKAYDTLHASPVKTAPEVADVEAEIMQKIEQLEAVISGEDEDAVILAAREIVVLTEKRNRTLQLP